MSRKLKTINVHIMEKEYPVACPPGQETTLMAAVDQVDKLMHTIKRNGRTVGVERIAVMAAINMSHELLTLKEKIASDQLTQTKSARPGDTIDNTAPESTRVTADTEALRKVAEEEAAIAAQLQALTEKLEATLNDDEDQRTAQENSRQEKPHEESMTKSGAQPDQQLKDTETPEALKTEHTAVDTNRQPDEKDHPDNEVKIEQCGSHAPATEPSQEQ